MPVVFGREQRAEFAGHGFFLRGVDRGIEPDFPHVFPRRLLVAGGDERPRHRQRTFRRNGLALGEMGEDEGGRILVHIERALGALQQRLGQRPIRRRIEEIHDAPIAGFIGMIAEIQELDQLDGGRLARAPGQLPSAEEIALERQFHRLNGNA